MIVATRTLDAHRAVYVYASTVLTTVYDDTMQCA
jgi:hypothetical protein